MCDFSLKKSFLHQFTHLRFNMNMVFVSWQGFAIWAEQAAVLTAHST